MMNILLFIHIVIAILLTIVILLQRTGADGLSGIGGNNMGIVSGRSATSFLTKITIILASMFFVNAIVLANLSSKKSPDIAKKIEYIEESKRDTNLPMAK